MSQNSMASTEWVIGYSSLQSTQQTRVVTWHEVANAVNHTSHRNKINDE